MDTNTALISAEHITKRYPLAEGHGEATVLDDITFQVGQAEVVALLGRSGSGKSTLLRILAGLIAPTSGRVLNSGEPLCSVNPDVAMVFQSFALLPWQTVLDNVELGLAAHGVSRRERRENALKAIDMVGLDGFESAYPKELSGGMKQRVGFARAFVVQPQVLLMDEPFSALDVLTAENLRGHITDLWETGKFPAKSILMVTHNIEEAVFLADRVVILTINPGRVRIEVPIDLPRPRERDSARFKLLVDDIYTIMTSPESEAIKELPLLPEAPIPAIPDAHVGEIGGLIEMLIESGGNQNIPILANSFQLAVDELLPILDAASLLGFVEIKESNVCITQLGREFTGSDIEKSKAIFKQRALANIPLVNRIYQTLLDKKTMRATLFLELLESQYTEGAAERQFTIAVAWGRYAELYEYDDRKGMLRLSD
jgi:NitT/TauT family transport system ATP-binding protein